MAEKEIIAEKCNAGLTRLLFALRIAATANHSSPFENEKIIEIEKPKTSSENYSALQLSPEDFPRESDSTLLLRDRLKNTKLEAQFIPRKGRVVSESALTVTLQSSRERQIISKRDVAKTKSKSTSQSPRMKRQKGDVKSRSLERKVAALRDAEKRAASSLTCLKQLAAATDTKRIAANRSPRKQAKPSRSLAGLPEKKNVNAAIMDLSSD